MLSFNWWIQTTQLYIFHREDEFYYGPAKGMEESWAISCMALGLRILANAEPSLHLLSAFTVHHVPYGVLHTEYVFSLFFHEMSLHGLLAKMAFRHLKLIYFIFTLEWYFYLWNLNTLFLWVCNCIYNIMAIFCQLLLLWGSMLLSLIIIHL